MSNTIANVTSQTEPAAELTKPAAVDVKPTGKASLSDPFDQGQFRLVIEEDQTSGAFVYKTLNRNTGEVVLQYPREQMLKLWEDAEYQAGAVIRTTV
ncbi:hypothetical protein BH11PSE2_BH11PSE2_07160 [soil metagenome]